MENYVRFPAERKHYGYLALYVLEKPFREFVTVNVPSAWADTFIQNAGECAGFPGRGGAAAAPAPSPRGAGGSGGPRRPEAGVGGLATICAATAGSSTLAMNRPGAL